VGRIAGAARRAVIYRALGEVGVFAGPVALVLPEADVAALPPLTAAQLADAAHGGAPSVLRRQLLVVLAGRALGILPESVRLVPDARGRRMLAGQSAFASVASRPGWVAAALADVPVGIDVELVVEAEAAREIALAGFDGDATMLAAWHGPAGVWAAKEAALKAHGRDLTSSPGDWAFGDRMLSADRLLPTRILITASAGAVVALASTTRR
jgi:hypothetical protein